MKQKMPQCCIVLNVLEYIECNELADIGERLLLSFLSAFYEFYEVFGALP